MPLSSPLATAVATQVQKDTAMSMDAAHDAARLAIAIAVGHLALEKTFNWGPSLGSVRTRWTEILGLLAKTHPA